MSQQKALLLFTCLLAFAASSILALPPGTPWTNFVSKPVYSRAIGPMSPSGMNTISVPYMPKSPFFPKFVDPKMMISKKTDMLSNLFSGLGPVAYDMADTKPVMPYGASGSPLDSTAMGANGLYAKRDSLPGGKEKMIDSSGMYKRGMFGPFAPKFGPMGPMGSMGPMGPKFGPFASSFSAADTMPDYTGKDFMSRRRRSIVPSSSANDISSILDKSQMTDSSYPKESAAATEDTAAKPKEYLPGMFGPGMYGPPAMFGPFGSAVDPSMLTAKKSAFLDSLFKNIASSTPAPTEAPVPKSTVVPPSFWIPSSIIPGPTEYTSKVSDFLDKLFDSLKLNATATDSEESTDAKMDFMRSLKPDETLPEKIARSLDDPSSIAAAKDSIVDSILSELGDLKGDMLATLNDLIAYEKSAAAAAAASKKPFKPPFAGLWPPKPTVDATLPFQQRMAVLSQVFDMLTDLQRNITVAANNAMAASATTTESAESPKISSATGTSGPSGASQFNTTLLDAVLKKLSTIATPISYPASDAKAGPVITSRALPKAPTSFWVSYPENTAAKRQADDYSWPYLDDSNDNNNRHDQRQYTRGVKMQMHQGYQSLPAGSVESVQAGGGSTPGHQGGGIRLMGPNSYGLNKWADWMQYHKNEYQDQDYHRHHHNHH